MQEAPLRGSFRLNPTGFDGLYETFSVTDVSWTASLGNTKLAITGSCTYRLGGELAPVQRLELELAVAQDPVQHYDSGFVPPGKAPPPALDATVSINHMYCHDTVMVVDAAPASMVTLTVLRAGAGTVTSDPSGIDCGADCSAPYAAGTVVTLIATPAAGSGFAGWGACEGEVCILESLVTPLVGVCIGTKPCTAVVSVSANIAAVFTFRGAGSAYSNEWVQKAYVAYYGRPADPAGLAYWATRMDAERGSLASIIGVFGGSEEFDRRYGGLGLTALVTRIYQQTLGRDPDPAGLAYYVAELQAGRRTLQSIALDVLGGATGTDSIVVANKLDVADHYTGKVGVACPYGGESAGASSLALVTADTATVWAAKLAIENRCDP